MPRTISEGQPRPAPVRRATCFIILAAAVAFTILEVGLLARQQGVGVTVLLQWRHPPTLAAHPLGRPPPALATRPLPHPSSRPEKYTQTVSAEATLLEHRDSDEATTRLATTITFELYRPTTSFQQLQTSATVADARPASTLYVRFFDPLAGLGNKMFQYAGGVGLAMRYEAAPRLVLNSPQIASALEGMRRVFRLSPLPEQPAEPSPTEVTTLAESGWGRYDAARFDNRANFERRNVTVVGYLQSWRYFQPVADQIWREFALTPYADAFVNAFLHRSGAVERSHVIIGLHVRRGDMESRTDLYTLAPPEYVLKAVEHYLTKYGGGDGGSRRGLTLVVATSDRRWVEAEVVPILPANVSVVFTGFAPEEDMAVLSRCNHSIVTAGTFGWWSAWLAGGDVVYYRDFIRPTSPLSSGLDPGDYYPEHWLGMS